MVSFCKYPALYCRITQLIFRGLLSAYRLQRALCAGCSDNPRITGGAKLPIASYVFETFHPHRDAPAAAPSTPMKTRLLYTESEVGDLVADECSVADENLQEAEHLIGQALSDISSCEPSAAPSNAEAPQTPGTSSRPHGRLAVACILAIGLMVGWYSIWNSFYRFSAHGMIVGRVSALSVPWSGIIQAVYARPGDAVNQGQALALIADPDLDASIERLYDRLRTTQAELDAQAAHLALGARTRRDETLEIASQYYELQGQLLAEQIALEELRVRRQRREQLVSKQVVTEEEFDTLRFREQSYELRIAKLKEATGALESRLEEKPSKSLDEAQLKPLLARLEELQGEIGRLREKKMQGILRAPFSGKVVSISGHVGELCSEDRSLVELLENHSLGIVVYIEQTQLDEFAVGHHVNVMLGNSGEELRCEVVSIGYRYEDPPLPIQSSPGFAKTAASRVFAIAV